MTHIFKTATTSRAKCRGCGKPIGKDTVRFGERVPNPFGSGEATQWFHPLCAAYKRPEPLLEALEALEVSVADREKLAAIAEAGKTHPRLARIDGVERSPTGQAACRHCREPIPKGEWRIKLVFHEEARFVPAGFLHARCAIDYTESEHVLDRLLHFSPDLDNADSADLASALRR